MDSIFIAHTFERPMAFLAKAEYFDHPVSKRVLSGLGQIPLRRGSPASARQAVSAACQALDSGWSIAIYPEGTRSRVGKLHRGNTGAARIAHQAQVPLVPVGLHGTESVQPPGQTLPRPFKAVTVAFGTPIDPPGTHQQSYERSRTA
jgi:1-acyl-sn-glycerol-3-phosphate acyltransferase